MEHRATAGVTSSDSTMWVWVILAGLLVVSTLIAVGALSLISFNQRGQQQTGTQSAPAQSAPAAAPAQAPAGK